MAATSSETRRMKDETPRQHSARLKKQTAYRQQASADDVERVRQEGQVRQTTYAQERKSTSRAQARRQIQSRVIEGALGSGGAPHASSGGATAGIIRIAILGLVLIVAYVALKNYSNTNNVLGTIGSALQNFASEKPLFTEVPKATT